MKRKHHAAILKHSIMIGIFVFLYRSAVCFRIFIVHLQLNYP